MATADFGNLRTEAGVAKLNAYMATRSYISGHNASEDDSQIISKLIAAPCPTANPHACRWYRHITSFCAEERSSWPKGTLKVEESKKQGDDDVDLFGDDDAGELEALKCQKKAEVGKKKDVSKSSLVIEIKPQSIDTDLDLVARMTKDLSIEGLVWGESVKKVPVAFGLFKLQMCCVIDDSVNTSDVTEQIELLGMTEGQIQEDLKRREKLADCDDDDYDGFDPEYIDGDSEEEAHPSKLVQSAEVVSFNKL